MKHSSLSRRSAGRLLVLASLAAAAPAARAQLQFDLDYAEGNSHAPSWDANGTHLGRIVEAAALHWESIYASVPATTIHIRFRWYDTMQSSVGLPLEEPCGKLGTTRRRLGGLTPNSYLVSFWVNDFGSSVQWYLDSDPTDHGEFELRPRMHLDPDDATTTDGVSAPGSTALEVGFHGDARDLHVVAGPNGVAASAGHDLFTVALHELGHALGLGFRGQGDARVDGDYDISAVLPSGGIALAAPIDASSRRVDTAHLECHHALMSPYASAGHRQLPSQIDILAIAQINGWTSVKLPRVLWNLPGVYESWGYAPAWIDHKPNVLRAAVIHPLLGSTQVDMLQDSNAASLFVGSGALLSLSGATLQAGQLVALDGSASLTATGGALQCDYLQHSADWLRIVGSGQLIVARRLELSSNAKLQLVGSPAVPARLVGHGATFRVRGQGSAHCGNSEVVVERLLLDSYSARFEGGATVVTELLKLENTGAIEALNGNLRFEPRNPGVRFDLDGSDPLLESGRLIASGGDLDFGAPLNDAFDGAMEIAAARTIRLTQYAPLGDCEVRLLGDEARLQAGHFDMHQTVILASAGAGSQARLVGSQVWRDSYGQVGGGVLLHLHGASTFVGGAPLRGLGGVRQAGDVFVRAGTSTSIDVANYYWDGEDPYGAVAGYSRTTVEPGASLRITGNISAGAFDGFDGVVVVESGATLLVDRDWVLEGRLELRGGTLLAGGRVDNRGVIRGYGAIATQVVNNGLIECEGAGIAWIPGAYAPGSGACGGGCCP